MSKEAILGYFIYEDRLLTAADRLKGAGFTEITIFSPIPVEYEIKYLFGKKEDPIKLFTFFGGIIGLLFGLLLVIGTSLLYVLPIDGRPIIVITPTIVISYETLILFGVISTLLGFFLNTRLPAYKAKAHDVKFDIDRFGLLVKADYGRVSYAEEIIRESGADEVKRVGEKEI